MQKSIHSAQASLNGTYVNPSTLRIEGHRRSCSRLPRMLAADLLDQQTSDKDIKGLWEISSPATQQILICSMYPIRKPLTLVIKPLKNKVKGTMGQLGLTSESLILGIMLPAWQRINLLFKKLIFDKWPLATNDQRSPSTVSVYISKLHSLRSSVLDISRLGSRALSNANVPKDKAKAITMKYAPFYCHLIITFISFTQTKKEKNIFNHNGHFLEGNDPQNLH